MTYTEWYESLPTQRDAALNPDQYPRTTTRPLAECLADLDNDLLLRWRFPTVDADTGLIRVLAKEGVYP